MNCHPPPCQPCNVNIKSNCHCGIAQVFYKCGQFYREINTEEETSILAQEKEKILSCGGRCIKNVMNIVIIYMHDEFLYY